MYFILIRGSLIIPYFCTLIPGDKTSSYQAQNEEKEIKRVIMQFSNNKLEPEDFYFSEEGYKVFTEAYHLKRGYCCKNNCRHCPYGFDPKKS